MVITTRYSVIFQKIPSRVRVAQKIPSSIRVAGTRWGLAVAVDRESLALKEILLTENRFANL